MKIGILLSRFPYPLEKGDKLRAFHQIRELSIEHEIYLCAIDTNRVSARALAEVTPYCSEIKIIKLNKLTIFWNLLKGLLFSKLPLQVAYFFKKSAQTEVVDFFFKHEVDHLFCQLIRVSEYVKDLKGIPKTLDYMDALSRGMERRINKAPFYLKPFVKIETTRLKRYEHFIFSAFDHKTIISEQDRDLIVHAENANIQIIRNGVDQIFFKPTEAKKEYQLVFTGNMSYPPNVDGVCYLVEEILPEVKKRMENISLAIVGANPSNRVQKLAGENVKITGWVDDIRSYYAASDIFIAPMQIGTGLQNKLLEAMAMGIPCITSSLANNALKATDEKHILIANSIEEYADAIFRLLEDEPYRKQIAQAGLNFIANNYNWKATAKQLEQLFLKSI